MIMTNFGNYCCSVLLLSLLINTCKTVDLTPKNLTPNDLTPNDLAPNHSEFHVGSSDDDDIFGLAVQLDQKNVCELPFDEGDCRDRSLSTDEDGEDSTSNRNELLKLEDLKELNELNELGGTDKDGESNTRYFGFNKTTKRCEQFNYDGCGGNQNRFQSIDECRKTCYTPISYFLAKVQDQLLLKISGASRLDKTTSKRLVFLQGLSKDSEKHFVETA